MSAGNVFTQILCTVKTVWFITTVLINQPVADSRAAVHSYLGKEPGNPHDDFIAEII